MDVLKQISYYANRCGERIALQAGDKAISYRELEDYSDRLAAWIHSSFTQGDQTPVVVYGHKSAFMIVCFLACVKAGRAYCPVDSSVPLSRVQGILDIVQPPVVFATEELDSSYGNVVGMDEIQRIALQHNGQISDHEAVKPDDVFYIIFTSGSTGVPKGVEITTDCLNRFLDWSVTLGTEKEKKEGKSFLNQAPFSFDLSVMDLYTSLSCGGTLWMMEKSVQTDYAKLIRFLDSSAVNVWVSTPSFADLCLADLQFCQALLPGLEVFLFCGETLTNHTAKKLLQRFPDALVVNTYGPTESTVAVTEVLVTSDLADRQNPLPVGRAKPNTCIEIRKEDGTAAADGEKGEIVILGDTVSTGYFHQRELTEKAFFEADQWGNVTRGYRTGDSGYLENGMLYYCGRIDLQIKLHGYRIEIEDIEKNLLKLPGIEHTVVVPVFEEGKVKSLTAVVTGNFNRENPFEASREIKMKLKEYLPEYMVPKKILFTDRIPMTNNGKADRKAVGGLFQ